MKVLTVAVSLVAAALFVGTSMASMGQMGARSVYIASPADGEVVTSPVTIRFGVMGSEGSVSGDSKSHELLVDLDKDRSLQMTLSEQDQQRLFAQGEAETSVGLAPGTHSLWLSAIGQPNEHPVVTGPIVITVK